MARKTVYNKITTPELLEKINKDNIDLMNDFLEYLSSIDRSPLTIINYKSDLQLFFTWCLLYNDNKYFVELTKRQISKFQNFALNECGWSSNRLRRVKSALSSMSNYIENILDDEIENFKPIIRKIENPVKEPVRDKTILSDEEVINLLDVLVEKEKYQCACAVALACYSGARKSELLRFKVDYFKDENIMLDGAMYKTPEKIKTKGRGGKLGKPLHKYTLIDFKKYYDLWMDKRKELSIESEWLFVTKENDKWVQGKVSTMDSYAETCTKLLNKDFYFHSLRHYLCTLLSEKKLPQAVIVEYFGWSSQEMVSVYCDSEATDSFGEYFTKDGIKEGKEGSITDKDNQSKFKSF